MRSWDWGAREGGGREGKAEEGDKRGLEDPLKNGDGGRAALRGAGWWAGFTKTGGLPVKPDRFWSQIQNSNLNLKK